MPKINFDFRYLFVLTDRSIHLSRIPILSSSRSLGGGGTKSFSTSDFSLMFIGTTPSFLIQIAQVMYQNNQWSIWKRTVFFLKFCSNLGEFLKSQKANLSRIFLHKMYQGLLSRDSPQFFKTKKGSLTDPSIYPEFQFCHQVTV